MNPRASILTTDAVCLGSAPSRAEIQSPDEAAFRDLYKELVEVNTTQARGLGA